MPRTTPAPEPDRTEAYAARTPTGRLVIAHLGPNPASPLHRHLAAAHLAPDTPEPETPQ
ncbi:hypothetical protein [Streptomyces lydicus]|uniref:hypothetical protein n=1 Tax=Streptomyces lydicus TaxID=47763 RepID=UPI0037FCDC20